MIGIERGGTRLSVCRAMRWEAAQEKGIVQTEIGQLISEALVRKLFFPSHRFRVRRSHAISGFRREHAALSCVGSDCLQNPHVNFRPIGKCTNDCRDLLLVLPDCSLSSGFEGDWRIVSPGHL